jgi:hypothetical protein
MDILKQSFWSFIKVNTYPITEFIIVNDSADERIHDLLKTNYSNATLVLNTENVGLIKSIDLGYQHIKTRFFLHCEDDWRIKVDGFINNALAVMVDHPEIEEVWPIVMNFHPVESKIYVSNNIKYRLIAENYLKCEDGLAWHGFTTSCALKRIDDYKRVGPYSDIPMQGKTIWDREKIIGDRYHQLGYRTAVLMGEYAENIGYGKSEYLTGMER